MRLDLEFDEVSVRVSRNGGTYITAVKLRPTSEEVVEVKRQNTLHKAQLAIAAAQEAGIDISDLL